MQKEAVEKLEDETDAMPNGLSVSMGEIQADHLTRELTEVCVDKALAKYIEQYNMTGKI